MQGRALRAEGTAGLDRGLVGGPWKDFSSRVPSSTGATRLSFTKPCWAASEDGPEEPPDSGWDPVMGAGEGVPGKQAWCLLRREGPPTVRICLRCPDGV